MERLLFIYSSSCKRRHQYIVSALRSISPRREMLVDRIPIEEYTNIDDSIYDYLIYNSFAGEFHALKFNKDIVYKADEKYHKFHGKKLLLDSHDDGDIDAYARFNDKLAPRLKYTPGVEYRKSFPNIIAEIPVRVLGYYMYNNEEKIVPLIYGGNKRGFEHNIRMSIANRVRPFNALIDIPHDAILYSNLLKVSKISVAAPGWGPIGSAHNEALAAGALLFSYESVKLISLLPFVTLDDGNNYVSFNFDNLEDKLNYLLKNEDEIKRISTNGRNTFLEGYNPRRTAEIIMKYFRGQL